VGRAPHWGGKENIAQAVKTKENQLKKEHSTGDCGPRTTLGRQSKHNAGCENKTQLKEEYTVLETVGRAPHWGGNENTTQAVKTKNKPEVSKA
jgi:hypothetical protein